MNGKVALVTGGNAGIGRAAAERFAARGAKVVITGRREPEGQAVVRAIKASGGEAMFVRADAAVEADNQRMVDETIRAYGRLDYAFNNAGVEGKVGTPSSEQTVENYRFVFDINVLGVLLAMKHEIPAMLRTGGGAIVNNASIAGSIGMAGIGVYVASKHAVIGLSKCAALEFSSKGVRVNTVSPAVIETDMYDRFAESLGGAEARQYMTGLHPIGRVGKPMEVAEAAVWLCSDAASFVTAHDLRVDGGFTAT